MADLNKVFLMGRLTFDPELRHTPGGMAVTELRMASSRSWTGKDGERREESLFIDVTVWDRSAENCCQYLKKGSSIHVEGYLRLETWDDKTTGEKRSKVKVVADRVQFLDRKESSGSSEDGGYSGSSSRESYPRRAGGSGSESRPTGNGPSRSFPPASSGGGSGSAPAPRRAPEPEPPGDDDEDIPF